MSSTFAPERRIDIVQALNELEGMGGFKYTAGDGIIVDGNVISLDPDAVGSDLTAGVGVSIADDAISLAYASDEDFTAYMKEE